MAAGAECDADAELARALLDRIREHAKHADHREHKREERKRPDEHGSKSRPGVVVAFARSVSVRIASRGPIPVDARQRSSNGSVREAPAGPSAVERPGSRSIHGFCAIGT